MLTKSKRTLSLVEKDSIQVPVLHWVYVLPGTSIPHESHNHEAHELSRACPEVDFHKMAFVERNKSAHKEISQAWQSRVGLIMRGEIAPALRRGPGPVSYIHADTEQSLSSPRTYGGPPRIDEILCYAGRKVPAEGQHLRVTVVHHDYRFRRKPTQNLNAWRQCFYDGTALIRATHPALGAELIESIDPRERSLAIYMGLMLHMMFPLLYATDFHEAVYHGNRALLMHTAWCTLRPAPQKMTALDCRTMTAAHLLQRTLHEGY